MNIPVELTLYRINNILALAKAGPEREVAEKVLRYYQRNHKITDNQSSKTEELYYEVLRKAARRVS